MIFTEHSSVAASVFKHSDLFTRDWRTKQPGINETTRDQGSFVDTSSRLQLYHKLGVLKQFAKFRENNQQWSFFRRKLHLLT